MVLQPLKTPPWLFLALILLTVKLSTQQNTPNTIQEQFQSLQQIILARLDGLDDNMNNIHRKIDILESEMGGSVNVLNDKVDRIEVAVATVGDRSSLGLSQLKVSVNDIKDQINSMNKDINISNVAKENQNINISTKLDMIKYECNNTLGSGLTLIRQEFSTELDDVKYQLNQSINTLMEHIEDIKTDGIMLFSLVESTSLILNQSLSSLQQPHNESISSQMEVLETSSNDTDMRSEHITNECPAGMFRLSASRQCFKWLNAKSNWESANQKCRELGLEQAKPRDPIALRQYLMSEYETAGTVTFLGAKSTGSSMKWQRDGTTISSSSTFWYPEQGVARPSSSCLVLLTLDSYQKSQPDAPYWGGNSCAGSYWVLCELVQE